MTSIIIAILSSILINVTGATLHMCHVSGNTSLDSGDSIESTSSPTTHLSLTADGQLALYQNESDVLWSTGTNDGHHAAFTVDGELLLYDEANEQIWQSHVMTPDDDDDTYMLVVITDCAYVISDKFYVSWNTGTDGCGAYPVTGLPLYSMIDSFVLSNVQPRRSRFITMAL